MSREEVLRMFRELIPFAKTENESLVLENVCLRAAGFRKE